MSNEYYNRTSQFAPRTKARSDNVRDELDAVALGFDKLPSAVELNLGRVSFGESTGASDAYEVTIPAQFEVYSVGQPVTFKAHAANTGPSSLNINSKGVIPIVRQNGDPLRANDIPLNGIMYAVYNGSQFRLVTSTARLVTEVEEATSAAISQVNSTTSAARTDVTNTASAAIENVNSTSSGAVATINNAVATATNDIDTTVLNATTSINSTSADAITTVNNVVSTATTDVSNTATNAITTINSTADNAVAIVEATVASIPEGTINDLTITEVDTWSSQKLDSEFNTRTILNKPTITSPTNGAVDVDTPITSSAYSSSESYNGVLDSVYWQIATDSAFTTILDEANTGANLEYSYSAIFSKLVYVRVRHGSDGHLSNWSDTIQFTTAGAKDNSEVDGLTSTAMKVAGNLDTTTDTGYFGEVPATDLIDNYDYRGNYLNDYTYNIGQVVIMNTGDIARYVSLVDSNLGNNPTSSPTQWALDEREFLPTGRWLYHQMGIGSAPDPYFGGGMLQHSGNAASDAGWLKFYSHGKVLYIAKKAFAHSISWNFIAARDAVYGNRTIRIGTKLYKVRLMTGASSDPQDLTNMAAADSCSFDYGGGSEWNELIYRVHETVLTCGSNEKHGGAQVGANWANFTTSEIGCTSPSKGWMTITQESDLGDVTKRVLRGNNTIYYLDSANVAVNSMVFGWRPVLELIPEDSPEYPTQGKIYTEGVGVQALTNYDFYTDTGYFGEVSSNDLFTGATLASDIGLASGTSINSTDGWLKFYWHGQILYIAKKPFRHTASWDDIYNRGAVWGIKNSNGVFGLGTNTGGTIDQGRTVTKGTDVYKVRLFKGAKNSNVNLSNNNASQENGGYSEWNELIYRIHQDTPRSDSGLAFDGGGQIGNNWANFTNADIVVAAGDGSSSWSMERRGDDTSSRVGLGSTRLSRLGTTTSSLANVGIGWRPVLILDS